MIGRDSKSDFDHYGPWPWIAGMVMALVLTAVMFGLADGFL